MTDLQLAEILNRAEAATPGPWLIEEQTRATWTPGVLAGASEIGAPGFDAPVATMFGRVTDGLRNAEFIAAARSDVPALVAALREAKELLREVEWQDAAPFGLQCPTCAALKREGHNIDCRLAAAIR